MSVTVSAPTAGLPELELTVNAECVLDGAPATNVIEAPSVKSGAVPGSPPAAAATASVSVFVSAVSDASVVE